MKKFYIIFPLVGCLLFGVLYWKFRSDFGEEERKKVEAKRVERENKIKADFEAKRKAMEEAIAQQEKRKVERAEKEKREAEERELQIKLNDDRDRARTEFDRVLRQKDRIQNEINVEDSGLKKLAAEKANLLAEDEFLQKYIALAEANQKNLEEVLKKIQKADADAEIAAKQQASKRKS